MTIPSAGRGNDGRKKAVWTGLEAQLRVAWASSFHHGDLGFGDVDQDIDGLVSHIDNVQMPQ